MIHDARRQGVVFPLIMLLALGGCAAKQSVAPGELPIGSRISLPGNIKALGDVACEFYKAGEKQNLEQFEIRCPGWERPAGQVWRGALSRPAINWQQRFLDNSDLAQSIEAEAHCGASESTRVLDDQPASLRRCVTHNGGFPYLLIVAGSDNQTFVLWGPAHLAPLFEGFILSSRPGAGQVKLAGTQSQLIALAEQAILAKGQAIGLEDMGQFVALDELSTLYNSAKNHQRALELAQRALEVHERIKGANDAGAGYLAARIARELSRLQPGAADAMFQRAERLVQASANPADRPEFLVYRAWHELSRGNRAQADRDATESWELSRAAAGRSRQGERNPRIAHSLIGVGDVYVELGKLAEAQSAYQQALKIFDAARGGDYHWVGQSHERLAEVYRRQQAFGSARAQAQAAVDLKRALFGEGRALAEALMVQAAIERDAGQARQALALWRTARDMLSNDRATLAQLRTEDIEGYLDLLFDLAETDAATDGNALLDEAFAVSQLGQAPAAGRAVTQAAARLAESDPAVREAARALQDALRIRQDTQYELGLEQGKPVAARNAAREAALKARLRAAAADYRQREERLQIQFPRYGRLVTPTPLNAAAVAKLLGRDEALLRILPGKNATWVFLVKTDGTLRGAALKLSAAQLTTEVEWLRTGVDGGSGQLPDFDLARAHALYRQLLGPMESALAGVQHLIVVPEGALLSLPPALLVRRPPADSRDYRGAGWLIRDMALSLLPSVVALEQFRQVAEASRASQPFIGFGNPLFTEQAGAAPGDGAAAPVGQSCPLAAESLGRLPPLPETAIELRTLARTLGAAPSSVVLGRQATVSAVQTSALRNYRIVAFATHALLPGELDCLAEPALVLTPQAGAKSGDNGLLTASAVADLKLDAEWVLLSACNTAGGRGGLRGEGLSGLATMFLYAGSRALLASHWNVVSEPTVFLTTRTFEAYRKAPGRGRAEALRQAQLALMDQPDRSHPIFWAAFTLIGESSPPP
ncbi:MAG: CHAT domain-containing protein [Candidatus Competibacter sp.]|nr:CHAT domain-containing protein [Candidatus Competibacter sp.]MDG4585488.1 CHAT domain-containing protein [Candidatus Competibacter sp.]